MQRLDDFITQQFKALEVLYKEKLINQFLMIFYITIDVLGAVSDKGFEGFSKKYVVENLSGITANDLWGARCGVLHANSPDSKKIKEGRARRIAYSWGKADPKLLIMTIQKAGNESKDVAVRIEDLLSALMLAAKKFRKDMGANGRLRNMCESKLDEFFVHVLV